MSSLACGRSAPTSASTEAQTQGGHHTLPASLSAAETRATCDPLRRPAMMSTLRTRTGPDLILDIRSRNQVLVKVCRDDGDLELLGTVSSATLPRKQPAVTAALRQRYGNAVARSMGYGNKEVHTAFDARGRIVARERDTVESAALALAEGVRR